MHRVHRRIHRAGRWATLAAVGVTVTVTVGCSAHPPQPSRLGAAGSAAPVSSDAGAGGATATSALADPAPAIVAGTARRGAVTTAVAFVRAALRTGPTAGWMQRSRRYTTTRLQRLQQLQRLQRQALPAPPATGATRVLSAQLAADTPSTAGTAQVEVAALITVTGGSSVPVTAYLTLSRTTAGWLVDAVPSWT